MHEVKLEHHLDNMRNLSHLVRDFILDVSDDFDDNKEQPIYQLLFHMPFIRSLTVIHEHEDVGNYSPSNKPSPYFSTWNQPPYRKYIMTRHFLASLTQMTRFPNLLSLFPREHSNISWTPPTIAPYPHFSSLWSATLRPYSGWDSKFTVHYILG